MKQLVMFSLALVMTLGSLSCNASDNKKADTKTAIAESNKVVVYYFHFTRRCYTCNMVESNAKLALEELYADKIKTGDYSFLSLNLDDASSKAIAEKLGVGGQSLLLVSGSNKIDITAQGFMNAQNLEKMKALISKTIGDLKI